MNLKTEDKLILLCAGTKQDDRSLCRMEKLIRSGLDWSYIINKAALHAVKPLLYYNLWKAGKNHIVPLYIMNDLQVTYQASVYRNVRIYNELGKILKVFETANIPIMALKGAALGEAVYRNIALRPMNDIDLLVKREDLPAVINLLPQMDYHPTKPENIPPEWYYKYSSSIHYAKKGGTDAEIDLHWNLVEFPGVFPMRTKEVWERAQGLEIGGGKALTLSPEDMLVYLCYHASFHHTLNSELRSLCDIAEIIRINAAGINWSNLLRYAAQSRLEHCIYGVLSLVKGFMEVEIPAEFFRLLQTDCGREFVYWIEHKRKNGLIHPKQHIETLIRLLLIPKNLDRARYFCRLWFPSRDYLALRNDFSPASKMDYLTNLWGLQKGHFAKLYSRLIPKI